MSESSAKHLISLLELKHMGPEDNFCSTKISKDSVLAKLSDLKCENSEYVNFKIRPLGLKSWGPFSLMKKRLSSGQEK